jgi:hypothetical protein
MNISKFIIVLPINYELLTQIHGLSHTSPRLVLNLNLIFKFPYINGKDFSLSY